MAKKQKQKEAETAYEAPEGFGINVGRERGEGWVTKKEGNEVLARILGRFSYVDNRGKKRGYYQLKLLKPCEIDIEDPDGEEDDEGNVIRRTITANEGTVVNADETAKLADLEPFTKNGGTYDVWFVIGPKIDIGGGQTMWSMAGGPRLRVVNAPSETPDQVPFR